MPLETLEYDIKKFESLFTEITSSDKSKPHPTRLHFEVEIGQQDQNWTSLKKNVSFSFESFSRRHSIKKSDFERRSVSTKNDLLVPTRTKAS